jgi:hypothetical protein
MNEELLIELAKQAEEYASKEYSSRKMGYDRYYYFKKKFAELIVQECANVADHSNVTGKSIIGGRIREYFGVEG